MIGETPSPARAGRRSLSLRRRQRLDPGLAGGVAAGEVVEEVEGLGQDVVARHRLELGDVERRQHAAQVLRPRLVGAGPGARSWRRGCRR